MIDAHETSSARLINLVVPGGGLILIGAQIIGVLVALLFTISAVFAIAATLLFPDDVSPTWRALAIGITLGTYLGAQIRYAQTVRYHRELSRDQRRRAALHTAQMALQRGCADDAWLALQPLSEQAEGDLLLAYRIAQVLTARGDGRAAISAWQRVRRLDRHRIYRREVVASEQRLAETPGENP